MNKKALILIEKLIAGDLLSAGELQELRTFFSEKNLKEEFNNWISEKWEFTDSTDVEISFDNLKLKLLEYEDSKKPVFPIFERIKNLSHYYQRIAAVLFIPLLLSISIYLFNFLQDDENYYTAYAPLGQKAKVELPDGSTVWLNSGSNIKYSSSFNKKHRNVELNGEAFFDVEKNTGKPFFVLTPYLDVKVTGTRFNVNAYEDEPFVETSLIEGKVEVMLRNEDKSFQITPGNLLAYSKSSKEVSSKIFNEEATIGWKENRLIFINDDFDKLTRKIEKWYDIEVICDLDDFKDNRLTVRLLEGEQLDRLLQIIESTVGAKCILKTNKIYITKK